jgi:hypothetical protein
MRPQVGLESSRAHGMAVTWSWECGGQGKRLGTPWQFVTVTGRGGIDRAAGAANSTQLQVPSQELFCTLTTRRSKGFVLARQELDPAPERPLILSLWLFWRWESCFGGRQAWTAILCI